ncbi:M24 family metallopeptidase [Bacteroidota bacterium]
MHDVWYDYKYDENTEYEPGMVMTMEPGLYFPADKLDQGLGRLGRGVDEQEFKTFIEKIRPVYEKYANIGVRIEDDILVIWY